MVTKEIVKVDENLLKPKRRRRASAKRRAARRKEESLSSSFEKSLNNVTCAVHSFVMKYQNAIRKVPAHLPPNVHAGPPSKRVKRVSWREDESSPRKSAMGGGGDPAVLAVGPLRKTMAYTKEELMHYRDSPFSKQPLDPSVLCKDAAQLLNRVQNLFDWPSDEDRGARGDAPNENQKGANGRERERKGEDRERNDTTREKGERKAADPRERVRKESEGGGGGIVLSPQRRSFTSGCSAARPRASSPNPGAATNTTLTLAKPDAASRRIGSGRIMVRDVTTWERGGSERPERSERSERIERGERAERSEETDRPERPEREIYRPPANRENAIINRNTNERYERRSFNRDSYTSDVNKRDRDDRYANNDKNRDREENRRSGNNRYNNRRYDKDEEPEWFSGGPTSQLDTIELRGFDEPTKKSTAATVAANGNAKDSEKWPKSNNSGVKSPVLERWRSEPASESNEDSAVKEKEAPVVEQKPSEEPQTNNDDQPEFNLDDFLKFDSIPEVLTNGSGEGEGSRFSRWFRRQESPTNETRTYERLLNMVDDLDNPRPTENNHASGQGMFAPISPAAAPPSLLDLLRRANADKEAQNCNNVAEASSSVGKMQSVEELEGRLRSQVSPHPDRDLVAFKRLLAQVSGGQAVAESRPPSNMQHPAHASHAAHSTHSTHAAHSTHSAHGVHALHSTHAVHAPPMSLMQMLNKSMEQQQQQQPPPPPAPQPHIPQELLYKLLQVQRQQQQQQQEMPPHSSERDLLQRPEAQAIIHGLKAGEITVGHLMQQVNNPGLQSRHRELLLTILRMHHHQRQMGGSPLPAGVPPHLVVPPHHQPLRLSPLPHTGVPARIPSPRELAAHTQSIMQSALIKKKLEEQRENFRRRHEMQQAKQPTPISFTPTSVLRKMTAEKEGESPSPKQQWGQPMKMPQGRPIVKGNQSGGGPPNMGYSPSPAEYQQYLNQQIQMPGMRQYPHQQQRQMPATSNMNNLSRGGASGATLQQLLMQTHQRTLNEITGGGVGAGGGDNQLARWFSPELLARASAGKLPSVHVPNALSLEELERTHHSPAVRN